MSDSSDPLAEFDLDGEEKQEVPTPVRHKSVETSDARRRREKYEIERALGKRDEKGNFRLKKLKHHHLRIIQLHLDGYTNTQIRDEVGVSTSTVARVLKDPLAEPYLQQAREARLQDIEVALGNSLEKANDLVINGPTNNIKLQAIDRVVKVAGHYKDVERGNELEVTLNVRQSAREKFAIALQQLADKSQAEDAEYEEVPNGNDDN